MRVKQLYAILRLKYWEEYTLKEIGEKLSLSYSRIQQLKTKAVRILRRALGRYSLEPIKILRLNDKLLKSLGDKHINNVLSLTRYSKADLLAFPGIEETDVEEIEEKLAMFGAGLNRWPYLVKKQQTY